MIIKTVDTITRNPEEFCPIPGNDKYLINCEGIVWSTKSQKFLKIFENCSGYPSISINIDGKLRVVTIFKLLAQIFIPNPNNYKYAYTIDGSKVSLDQIGWYEKRKI